jgi:hypothetical protein
MKIIIKEGQFRKLNESLGVNEAAIEYTNFIYNFLEPNVIKMIAVGEESSEIFEIKDKELLDFIKNDPVTFEELPIGEIEIELSFIPLNKESIGGKPFMVDGGYYDLLDKEQGESYMMDSSFLLPKSIIEDVPKTVHAKLGFEIYTSLSFDESLMDEMLFDLRDAITHEINHLYESYKKWQRTGKGSMNLVKSLAGRKNINTPRVIFDVYSKFLNFLYYSQPWEINANVQEAFSKISRMSFDEFKKTNQWKIADEMENYSADELFKELVKTAEDKNPETVDYHIRNLHKFYLKQYKNYDEAYREAEDIKDKVYNTKNLLGLFKKFEKRINNAGKKLKRNYSRLMSIDKNG